MKRTFALSIVLALTLGVSMAMAAKFNGVVVENKCGAAHKGGSEKDIACIKSCVANKGAKLALLVGDDLFVITNPEKATGHEGHAVVVEGKEDKDKKTITIHKLEMAKN
ncbi:MAG: hypothetical protein U0V70_03805 [Terriglobia bacterium]